MAVRNIMICTPGILQNLDLDLLVWCNSTAVSFLTFPFFSYSCFVIFSYLCCNQGCELELELELEELGNFGRTRTRTRKIKISELELELELEKSL